MKAVNVLLILGLLICSLPTMAIQKGDSLPDASLPLLSQANQSISFQQLKGQIVYVDFWASWCVPCRKSFPFMNQIQQKYAQQGLKIIAVNMDEFEADAQAFLQQFPAEFDVVKGSSELGKVFDLKGLPTAFLSDHTGKVVAVHTGFNERKANKVEQQIAFLLKQAKQ